MERGVRWNHTLRFGMVYAGFLKIGLKLRRFRPGIAGFEGLRTVSREKFRRFQAGSCAH